VRLALKVDVDTLRGTREGVPALVEIFRKHGVGATFLFSMGPDHTGRAIKRVFRPGFVGKVRRTGVVEHYGVRTLMYGTLLPGPDIGKRAGDVMRMTRDEGFETGHPLLGPRALAGRPGERRCRVDRARDAPGGRALHRRVQGAPAHPRRRRLADERPRAADDPAPRLRVLLGRARRLAAPSVLEREPIRCPQFPTTLPTLDELIGLDGVDAVNVADRLLAMTDTPLPTGHVFTLHAELEGMRLAPVLEQLISGWKAQGYAVSSVRSMVDAVEPLALPRCAVGIGDRARAQRHVVRPAGSLPRR
jgi:peptidoglycan/xylan/chitin deacetylase (PgdA/CDA1 family)